MWSIQSTTDRRQQILEYLSDVRQTTLDKLAENFSVSKRTIRYDLEVLTCSAPIVTATGRYNGGIRVADGWYISRRYLHSDQETLLRELIPNLKPKQQEIMQSILDAFAKPAVMV